MISSNFWKKERNELKFSWLARLFKHFFRLKFSPMWVSKKRNNKESMIYKTPRPSQSFFVYRIQSKEKKRKEGFLTALAAAI